MQFTFSFWRSLHAELDTRLDLSTTLPPQINGQSEQTILLLKDMLCTCVIDFGDRWNKFLTLGEFAYNNSYYFSIDITSLEALYERRCKSFIDWFDVFEVKP